LVIAELHFDVASKAVNPKEDTEACILCLRELFSAIGSGVIKTDNLDFLARLYWLKGKLEVSVENSRAAVENFEACKQVLQEIG
jgi:hypothetical protein